MIDVFNIRQYQQMQKIFSLDLFDLWGLKIYCSFGIFLPSIVWRGSRETRGRGEGGNSNLGQLPDVLGPPRLRNQWCSVTVWVHTFTLASPEIPPGALQQMRHFRGGDSWGGEPSRNLPAARSKGERG